MSPWTTPEIVRVSTLSGARSGLYAGVGEDVVYNPSGGIA